jgi:hypothetical protein
LSNLKSPIDPCLTPLDCRYRSSQEATIKQFMTTVQKSRYTLRFPILKTCKMHFVFFPTIIPRISVVHRSHPSS